jgi:hypothetical protein
LPPGKSCEPCEKISLTYARAAQPHSYERTCIPPKARTESLMPFAIKAMSRNLPRITYDLRRMRSGNAIARLTGCPCVTVLTRRRVIDLRAAPILLKPSVRLAPIRSTQLVGSYSLRRGCTPYWACGRRPVEKAQACDKANVQRNADTGPTPSDKNQYGSVRRACARADPRD